MAVWAVTSRNSNGEIAQIEARTKKEALSKARRMFGNAGERNWMGKPTKQAVYVTKMHGNSSSRGNPSKLQRALMTQKKRTERRVADALAKYLKVQNPGQKITAAKVQRLKGGVIKITPMKGNPAPN